GVEDRGLSPTFTDNLDAALKEALRALLAQLQVRGRLKQPHFVDHLENQVSDLVDAIRAIRFEASIVDVGKVGVSAALRSRHADLGRRGLIVEFHPKAFEQFLGPVTSERSVGETLLVKGVKMLVQPPRAEGVPGIQFADYAQVREPVGLQGLPEISRCMCWNAPADVRYFSKLDLA